MINYLITISEEADQILQSLTTDDLQGMRLDPVSITPEAILQAVIDQKLNAIVQQHNQQTDADMLAAIKSDAVLLESVKTGVAQLIASRTVVEEI